MDIVFPAFVRQLNKNFYKSEIHTNKTNTNKQKRNKRQKQTNIKVYIPVLRISSARRDLACPASARPLNQL
jgi:hypothetical protein